MSMYELMSSQIDQRRGLLVKAMALSAKRGGFGLDMSHTVAQLSMWLREENPTFESWNGLIAEADSMIAQWRDWYSRIYTRPHDSLDGQMLADWYGDVQQRVLESRIIDLDQGAA